MLARIIGGLAKANVAITLAIVSDSTTDNERNRAMVRALSRSNACVLVGENNQALTCGIRR